MAQLNIHRVQIVFGIGGKFYHLSMKCSYKCKILALRIADNNVVLCDKKTA